MALKGIDKLLSKDDVEGLALDYARGKNTIEERLEISKVRNKNLVNLSEELENLAIKIMDCFYANKSSLAKFFGVTTMHIDKWLSQSDRLREAWELNQGDKNKKVEEALFKRAVGFTKKKQVVSKIGDVIEVEEEVDPNVEAAKHWLAKRSKEEWGEEATKHELEVKLVPVINMGGEKVIEIINEASLSNKPTKVSS
jgi:hypothetical protein